MSRDFSTLFMGKASENVRNESDRLLTSTFVWYGARKVEGIAANLSALPHDIEIFAHVKNVCKKPSFFFKTRFLIAGMTLYAPDSSV